MILGIAAPRFIYASGSVDFTETGFYVMKKKEPVSKDIIRDSQITSDRKYIEVGGYLEFQYVFYNKTKAEIDNLKTMFGKEITFIPHSEHPLSYFISICTEVRAEMTDGNALKYRLYISVISKNFVSNAIFRPSLTISSPTSLTYLNGNIMNIAWASTNISSTEPVKIELYKAGVYVSTMTSSTLNTGSYNWIIAACLEGSDYQVKISAVRDSSIYALSVSNFSILYNGWISPNGTDQYATLPFNNLGNTFSIAFAYKEWAVSTLRYPVLYSNTNYFQLGSDTFNTNRLVFRAGTNSNQAFYSTVGKLSISSSAWHTAVVAVNISANTVKMYFDGVEDTGVAGAGGTLADETYALLQLFKANIYFNNMKTKHIVITSDEMTATEALAHYNSSISSIDNQLAWYKCNDESGNLIDSANGNDATVYNASSTFYNQYPEFDIDENGECITDENHEPIPIL